jgi:hypothetical protein
MFVKILTLLFSNIYFSFSVLLCCRSLVSKCDLKGGIGQNAHLVPANALECNDRDRAHLHQAHKASVRAQNMQSSALNVNLLP